MTDTEKLIAEAREALEIWPLIVPLPNALGFSRHMIERLANALSATLPRPTCLCAIATNEPCRSDETLRRCTVCGFIVDIKYNAEFPPKETRDD